MRKLFVVLFITLIAVAQTASQTSSAGAAATTLTVIRAGSLIDGTSDAARKNQLIFVRGERIEKVVDASATIPAVFVLHHGVGISQNLLCVLRRDARTVVAGICRGEILSHPRRSVRYVPALYPQRGPDEGRQCNPGGGRSGRDSLGAVGRRIRIPTNSRKPARYLKC